MINDLLNDNNNNNLIMMTLKIIFEIFYSVGTPTASKKTNNIR